MRERRALMSESAFLKMIRSWTGYMSTAPRYPGWSGPMVEMVCRMWFWGVMGGALTVVQLANMRS